MTGSAVDLVVIGSGPAGMAAACQARELGLTVIVLDEQTAVGGQIYRNIETAPDERLDILGKDYADGLVLAEQFRSSGSEYICGAAVWSLTSEGVVDYVANGKVRQIVGKTVLVASGAIERPFPVKGWTLPGVMGAGAGQILLKGSGALPTEPIILAGAGPLLYLLAWQYLRAGAKIAALVDTAPFSSKLRALRHLHCALLGWRDLAKGLKLLAAIRRHGVPVFSGATQLVVEGEMHATGLSFSSRGKRHHVAASLLLLHQGVVPNTQLSWSVGAQHHWNPHQLCWHPLTDAWGRLGDSAVYVAGDSRAIVGAQASAVQGRLAALAIGERLNKITDLAQRSAPLWRSLARYTRIRPFLDVLYRPSDDNRIPPENDVMVCRCEEVSAGQIRQYVSLGCLGPNQTKAFGRCGMGPCQGRLCGLTVTELIASERGVEPTEVGYYRIRPPIKPVMLGDFVE